MNHPKRAFTVLALAASTILTAVSVAPVSAAEREVRLVTSQECLDKVNEFIATNPSTELSIDTCTYTVTTEVSEPAISQLDEGALREIYDRVMNSPDPLEAYKELPSDIDRDLFQYAISEARQRVETTFEEVGADCSRYTTRGKGYGHLDQALYDFYTTGDICRGGNGVENAAFIDGGGSSGAVFWSYKGMNNHAAAAINGWGYVYGAYQFELNINGIVAQSPVACGRVVGSVGGANFGDTTCGIG